MRYIPPQDVVSPRDLISNLQVIHDGGDNSVSIARFDWDGKPVIGMRWNIAIREWDEPDKINNTKACLGMPVSRGYPTWFILPNDMLDPRTGLASVLEKLKK